MRTIRLVIALALAFGTASTAFAGDGMAEDRARFFDSDYTVCDAHFVSKTFGFDLSESKAYIGQKIGMGTTHILDKDLEKARKKGRKDRTWRCQFYRSGYSYDDAEALAAYWGISVSDAKVRVEEKILLGNERLLAGTVLPEARRARGGTETETENEAAIVDAHEQANMRAFFDSKYDACHAHMLLGSYFGMSLAETKSLIGYKVANGLGDIIDEKLEEARQGHQAADTVPCGFQMTPYTYDDAAALAKLWGGSVSEAKARIERKYAWGTESIIADELKRAGK